MLRKLSPIVFMYTVSQNLQNAFVLNKYRVPLNFIKSKLISVGIL